MMRILGEGWFCPGCQAYHSPSVDTCEIVAASDTFQCAICKKSAAKYERCDRADCLTHVLVGSVVSKEVH